MSNAARVDDPIKSHCGACQSPDWKLIQGSEDTTVNNMPAVRQGDPSNPHGCKDHNPHQDTITTGSSTVRINKIPAARKKDPLDWGNSVAEGSPDVLIGG